MWNLSLMMLSPNTPWVSFILPSLVRMSMMLDTLPAVTTDSARPSDGVRVTLMTVSLRKGTVTVWVS